MWNRRKDDEYPQKSANVPQSPATPAQTSREVPYTKYGIRARSHV